VNFFGSSRELRLSFSNANSNSSNQRFIEHVLLEVCSNLVRNLQKVRPLLLYFGTSKQDQLEDSKVSNTSATSRTYSFKLSQFFTIPHDKNVESNLLCVSKITWLMPTVSNQEYFTRRENYQFYKWMCEAHQMVKGCTTSPNSFSFPMYHCQVCSKGGPMDKAFSPISMAVD